METQLSVTEEAQAVEREEHGVIEARHLLFGTSLPR
jgi:hypothetical protein